MTVIEFCNKFGACEEGRAWVADRGALDWPLSKLWLLDIPTHYRIWIFLSAGGDAVLAKRRIITETPIVGGTFSSLLIDERSLQGIEDAQEVADMLKSNTDTFYDKAVYAAAEAASTLPSRLGMVYSYALSAVIFDAFAKNEDTTKYRSEAVTAIGQIVKEVGICL